MKKLIPFVLSCLLLLCGLAKLLAQPALPALPKSASSSNNSSPVTNGVLWVDDSLPAGAVPGTDGGDAWTWISTAPTPFSGTLASQASIAAGLHQHFFDSATETLTLQTGDVLFAYVYLDALNLPSELMLQWNDGSWEHRAFWGANNISYGNLGTASLYYAGPLPPAGKWVRLEVRASQVGLEGSTLNGMAFSVFDGRATWDAAGKAAGTGIIPPTDTTPPTVTLTAPAMNTIISGANVQVSADASDDTGVAGVQFKLDGANLGAEDTTPPYSVTLNSTLLINGMHNLGAIVRDAASNRGTSAVVNIMVGNVTGPPATTNNDLVWFDDTLPTGAVTGSDGGDDWNWVTNNPAPFSGVAAHQSNVSPGSHQHFFNFAWTTFGVSTGDTLVAYVYLDTVNPPAEVMIQWNNGSWEHRAYWGTSLNSYGAEGTVSRRFMGLLPPVGQWVRLEVPAKLVGLEGSTLQGMSFTLFGGQATWDWIGKRSSTAASIQKVDGGMAVTWPSVAGQTYRVLFKTDLLYPDWNEISGPITATDSTTTWTDITTDFDQQRYYEIVQ